MTRCSVSSLRLAVVRGCVRDSSVVRRVVRVCGVWLSRCFCIPSQYLVRGCLSYYREMTRWCIWFLLPVSEGGLTVLSPLPSSYFRPSLGAARSAVLYGSLPFSYFYVASFLIRPCSLSIVDAQANENQQK